MAATILKEMTTKEFWLCVASEFFGCFFFVFIAAGSAIRMDPGNPPSVLLSALTAGLTVSTLVMATFHTSGGLVNPALTIGFVVARKISILRGVFYFVGQVLGGKSLLLTSQNCFFSFFARNSNLWTIRWHTFSNHLLNF